MNKFAFSIGLLAFAGASSAQAAFYNNEAAFLANVQAGYYLENFDFFTHGNPPTGHPSWIAPGANGFGWTASADQGLFTTAGALSTNVASDPLTITFTGAPVTAFGGIFTATDFVGSIVPGTVTITLSNGETQTLTNPTSSTFFGWTGSVAISSITINSPTTGSDFRYAQMDHFYVGTAVPAPGALAILGLAGLVSARRRRA